MFAPLSALLDPPSWNLQLFLFNGFFVCFIASRNFSSYIFIIVTSSASIFYVTRPLDVSPAFLEYLSYISFASVIRSERTIERRYRNARQRVINNSASGLAATPNTTSETFPVTAFAIINHRRTTRNTSSHAYRSFVQSRVLSWFVASNRQAESVKDMHLLIRDRWICAFIIYKILHFLYFFKHFYISSK